MPLKTHHGSCDCGKVKFQVGLDLTSGTFKCNCKICSKGRFWGIGAKTENFKLLSGEADLTQYGVKVIHHFCKHCGTKLFGRSADNSGMAISLAVLDDLTPEEMTMATIKYYDGINDNWKEAPKFTAHL